MTLSGPDVSHHQGNVNWAAVHQAGHAFAWVKATEGVSYSWAQSWFPGEWAELRKSGLVPGAYHFLRSDADPAAQARYFVSIVGSFAGCLAAVDVETGTNGSQPTGAQAEAFANEFRHLTGGHTLVCYTGRWYWKDAIGNPQNGPKVGPLWHSAYSSTPGAVYGGWTEFTMWQWTSSGSCPGISGSCDLNTFYGDHADLLALTGDDMVLQLSDEDLDAIEARVAKASDESGKRQSMFIMDGRQNAVYNPAVKGNEWMKTALDVRESVAATKTNIEAAVKASNDAIIAAIEALPAGPGGGLDREQTIAAVQEAGRRGTGIVT